MVTPEHILFTSTIFLLVLAAVLWRQGLAASTLRWLIGFAVLEALAWGSWFPLLVAAHSPLTTTLTILLHASAYLSLIEFATTSLRTTPIGRGRWFHVVLLLAAVSVAWPLDVDGYRAVTLALGVPSCLLAGALLMRSHGVKAFFERSPFLLGVGLVAYALCLVVHPLSQVAPNRISMPAWAEPFPALAAAAPVALGWCALAGWFACRVSRFARSPGGLLRSAAFPATVVLLLAGGVYLSDWRGRVADQSMRDLLMAEAVAVASTIHPEQVRSLTFTEVDTESPVFQRLRRQLIAYGRAVGLRSIYSTRLRDGVIVFGPESLAEDDPWASPPGTVYEQPRPNDFEIFVNGKPFVVGPVADEYGTFVSTSAPVVDPKTGEVLMTIGVDIDASEWLGEVARHRLLPMVFTLVVFVLLLGGRMIIHTRDAAGPVHGVWLGYAEAVIVAVAGITITAFLVALSHEAELRHGQSEFRRLARAQAGSLVSSLFDLRDYQLSSIGRLFQSSDHVTEEEFETFVLPLLKSASSMAFRWSPAVAVTEADAWIKHTREHHPSLRTLRPPDAVTDRDRDLLFPVLFGAPRELCIGDIGTDLTGDARRDGTIREAILTRVPTASRQTVATGGTSPALTVFGPIFERETDAGQAGRESLKGLIMATINPAALLRESSVSSAQDPTFPHLSLFFLTDEGVPYLIATQPDDHKRHAPRPWSDRAIGTELSAYYPLFAFGRAMLLILTPSSAYLAGRPIGVPWLIGSGGVVFTIILTAAVAFVVSRRAQLQRDVVSSEERYRALFDTMTEGFALCEIILDNHGTPVDYRFLDVNASFETLTGLKRDAVVGRTVKEVIPDIEPEWIDRFGRIALKGEPGHFEQEAKALRRLYSLHAYRPSPGRFAVVFSDITAQRKAEEERQRLELQLIQAQKMEVVGRLAGGVAHDFNNLLQAILGFTEVLIADSGPGGKGSAELSEIKSAGERARSLTRQLLAFSRKQMLVRKPVNLNDLIDSHLGMLRRLLGEDISIETRLTSDVHMVRADAGQIEQVILNMAVNARDAMPGGGRLSLSTENVTITPEQAAGRTDARAGAFVRLSVADNGQGMSDDVRKHLFEPFFTTKPKGQGTGLGLATSYGIIQQHEGWIEIESAEGKGSTFRIYLPTTESSAVAIPDLGGEEPIPPPGKGQRILVVEDEPGIRSLMLQTLRARGYDVLVASTAAEAIQLATQSRGARIEMAVCDVVLPDMNGLELTERLTALLPGIRLLLISGYTDEKSRWPEITQRGLPFLQKPFPMAELLLAIHRQLALRSNPTGS